MKRRDFLRTAAAAAAGMAAGRPLAGVPRRPNILVIITDQQHAGMLGCTGNPWVKTPNMDRLAAAGTRFERAYAANPVCVPSRFTLMTGLMPSAIGVENNQQGARAKPGAKVFTHALGAVFRAAGYRTVYGGKRHMVGQRYSKETMTAFGFDEDLAIEDYDGRQPTVEACARFLRGRHERPFLLVASLINPHDICFWLSRPRPDGKPTPLTPSAEAAALIQRMGSAPEGVAEDDFYARHCPPLPPNHEIPEHELSAAKQFRGPFRQALDAKTWQRYRRIYAGLTELVDGETGQIIDALREAGLEENTVVVFTSDHGDMDGAHRMTGKSLLYEESARVPFIVSWKGRTQAGGVDREHLVSNGLDLIPTLCDFAGIAQPAALKGRSVRALAEGGPGAAWRDHLVIESEGMRAVIMGKWKYTVGHKRTVEEAALKKAGAGEAVREVVIDLERDPGEMVNLARKPEGREALARGRRLLRQWYDDQGMALDPGYVV